MEQPRWSSSGCGTTIWLPETSVSIWNLLWLVRALIICTERTNISINTFPNTITSLQIMAKNQEKNTYFSINGIVGAIALKF